jgi:hypothetical protein
MVIVELDQVVLKIIPDIPAFGILRRKTKKQDRILHNGLAQHSLARSEIDHYSYFFVFLRF